MAEVIFNKLSDDTHEVSSAGTRVLEVDGRSLDGKEIIYKDLTSPIMESLDGINVLLETATRTQLTPEIVEAADLIVSMAEPNTAQDYLTSSPKFEYWEVVDPKCLSLEETNVIRDDIVRRIEELVARTSK
jgi:protein-tyrosine-phosphatase